MYSDGEIGHHVSPKTLWWIMWGKAFLCPHAIMQEFSLYLRQDSNITTYSHPTTTDWKLPFSNHTWGLGWGHASNKCLSRSSNIHLPSKPPNAGVERTVSNNVCSYLEQKSKHSHPQLAVIGQTFLLAYTTMVLFFSCA